MAQRKQRPTSALRTAFAACFRYFFAAAAFSFALNILNLAVPLYMMQVYDRVLSSGSEPTLVMLTIAVVAALVVLSVFDEVRTSVLVGWGIRIDAMLSARVLAAEIERASASPAQQPGQAMRDLDTLRQFVTGTGTLAFLDLLWTPLYLVMCFMLHPLLGMIAFAGMVLLVILAFFNQAIVTKPMSDANAAGQRSYRLSEAALRNAEAVQAMGMLPGILGLWRRERIDLIKLQAVASRRNAVVLSIIRFLRMALQVAILAVGAWLAIEKQITGGVMYAAMMLATRAVGPVDQVVGVWNQIISAFSAAKRVDAALAQPMRETTMRLPDPMGKLTVEGVTFAAPGTEIAILRGVTFGLNPGESLGIIGPTAAGKSTLARLIVGVWKPYSGVVRLDGADTYTWDRSDFGRHVGYLPQDIELFAGTVADNIARFGEADPELVIEAARKVGIHDMILRLPKGYDTEIGEGGTSLSGGQRQRIGLARAVFGSPRLVLLDEPNSNLDGEGEEALRQVLARLKQDQVTVVIVAHRPSMLVNVDKLLVLRAGLVDRIGPTAQVMTQLMPQARVIAMPIPGQPGQGGPGGPGGGPQGQVLGQIQGTARQA